MITNKNFILIGLLALSGYTISAQSFNKQEGSEGKQLLLGKINKTGLSEKPYDDWFTKNYTSYIPKQEVVNSIKNTLDSYTIKVFMGTWCGDSKREVPKFYKVLDKAGFPIDRLTTVAVHNKRDQYKQSPGGEHEGLNIHRVPVFIFYKNGIEINRIVESPKKSLEEDIRDILSNNYTSKYESVTFIDYLINDKGSDYLTKKSKKIISKMKSFSQHMYELNTYANVLYYGNRKKDALAVLQLNTQLFPQEANTYISLGNKHLQMENPKEALKFYEESLKISKNTEIENKIKKLKTSLSQG